jgi:hypothetical protein
MEMEIRIGPPHLWYNQVTIVKGHSVDFDEDIMIAQLFQRSLFMELQTIPAIRTMYEPCFSGFD